MTCGGARENPEASPQFCVQARRSANLEKFFGIFD